MPADRSIVARLRAEAAQFMSTMAQAKKAAKSVGEGAEEGSKQADSSFLRMRKSVQDNSQHIDRLGNAALVAGGAIVTGLGVGIKSFADFDEAMSGVSAALPQAGAEMEKLRQLAIDLGRDSQYSATEAAQGITELAKAGVDAQDIIGGGLKGALDLAAAGGLDVAQAAETIATNLNVFSLSGDKASHVADLLAAGAGKAQGEVTDMALALDYAGGISASLGVSIEETAGTLGYFASQGIIGEKAGTSYRSMLLSLTAPSKIAAAQMEKLGINVYDTSGNFIGMQGAADELQRTLGPLDQQTRTNALGQIFGNESINAAIKLYEGGGAAVAKWTNEVNSAGFAAEQAAKKTDNLKGDLERLGGAIDAVFVENGEGANAGLRKLTQSAESAVEAFSALPDPIQQGVFVLGGLTGAGLLMAGAFAKAVTTAADMAESMESLRTKSPRAAKGMDTATKAAKGLGVALAAVGAAAVATSLDGRDSLGVQQLTKDLQDAGNVVDVLNQKIASVDKPTLAIQGVKDLGDAIRLTFDPAVGEEIDNFGGSIIGAFGGTNLSGMAQASDRLNDIDTALSGMVSSGNAERAASVFGEIADEAQKQGVSVEDLKAKFPQYAEALAAVSNQSATAADATKDTSTELVDLSEVAGGATSEVKDLAEAIRGFGSTTINADEAQDNFREAVENVTSTVKDNAKAVKDGEKTKAEAARDNREAVRNLAKAVLENSAATLEATGSAEKARAKMAEGREEFIKSAREAGYTAKQAKNLADKYGLIPGNVTTVVRAQGAEAARADVQNLINTIRKLNSKTVTVGVRYTYSGKLPGGGRSTAGGLTIDADGGMHVNGPGGLVKAYADGGMWDGSFATAQPQVRAAGGRGVLWAEEGAGPWEAFVSGHPARRDRSRSITEDVANRLGGRVEWATPFAAGGILTRGLEAMAAAGAGGYSPTFIAQGLDAQAAIDKAMRQYEYRVVNGL